MKAYKGFNKDMTCLGFQYAEGKTFETDGAVLCKKGFHACEAPLDAFGHYAPGSSVYHAVELEDVSPERREDSKVTAKKITVGARLSIRDLASAQISFVKEHTTTEHTDPDRATAGDYGAATAGDNGAATAGDHGAATAGDYGAATAGDYGEATAGSCGAATAGDFGAATSRCFSASGKDGLSVARGFGVRVKGGLGALLVIAEEDDVTYGIAQWKVVIVDGDKIKPDTWYRLNEEGELVEA